MATSNGVLSSPQPTQHQSRKASSHFGTKRKRGVTLPDNPPTNVPATPPTPDAAPNSSFSVADFSAIFLKLLASHDPTPSLLKFPIATKASKDASEPEPKRPKLSAEQNLASKLSSGAYATVEDIVLDVRTVASAALAPFRKTQRTESYSSLPPPLSSKQQSDITAIHNFVKFASSLLTKQLSLPRELNLLSDSNERPVLNLTSKSGSGESQNEKEQENGDKPEDGVKSEDIEKLSKEEGSKESATIALDSAETRGKVLEIYCGGSSARSLFSSLVGDSAREVSAFFHEASLPNGLHLSRVNTTKKPQVEKVPTLGELFPASSRLESVPFPQQSKHTSTRSLQVGWYKPNATDALSRRPPTLSYTSEHLPTGQWISYGSITSPSSSPEAKKHKRARTLSSGEAESDVPDQLSAAEKRKIQEAKDLALFRSVYSNSWAPNRDNTGAVIPTEVKDQFWWACAGQEKFEQSFEKITIGKDNAIDPELLAEPYDEKEADDSDFEEVVRDWDPKSIGFEFPSKKEVDKEDVNEMLQEISELIETLYSHQRIRNSSLGSAGHSSGSSVVPEEPSSDEVNVYDILKQQLAFVVGSLPPYLFAKLNGDRLAALNISRTIVAEVPVSRGKLGNEDIQAKRDAAQQNPSIRNSVSNQNVKSYAAPNARGSALTAGRSPIATPGQFSLGRSSSLSNRAPTSNPLAFQANALNHAALFNGPPPNPLLNANGVASSAYNPSRYNRSASGHFPSSRASLSGPSSFSTTPSQPAYAQRALLQQQQAYKTPYGRTNNISPQRTFPQQYNSSRFSETLSGANRSMYTPASFHSPTANMTPQSQQHKSRMSPTPTATFERGTRESPRRAQKSTPDIEQMVVEHLSNPQPQQGTGKDNGESAALLTNGGDAMAVDNN